MNNRVTNLLKILIIIFLIPKCIFPVEKEILEDKLIGIQIGSTTQVVNSKYSGLYAHKLMLGEILYEACNQDKLEVITFTENPWAESYITMIWLRQEEDQTVCRDETGALPDLDITIETPRGIRLGDSKEKIISKYGNPHETRKVRNDYIVMTYIGEGDLVEKLRLIFTLNNNELITDITLTGNIPGTQPPFSYK